MYSFLLADGRVHTENTLTKGVPKCVVANHLTFVHYDRCLDEPLQLSHTFKAIRSVAHSMSRKELEKVSLSSFDEESMERNKSEKKQLKGKSTVV